MAILNDSPDYSAEESDCPICGECRVEDIDEREGDVCSDDCMLRFARAQKTRFEEMGHSVPDRFLRTIVDAEERGGREDFARERVAS